MQYTIRAGCKVNLYLDIVGVRADGYHEIESLFYPLPEPCDILTVEEDGGRGLHLSCSDPTLASPDNILTRAYAAFSRVAGFAPGLAVHLNKGIPMGAGLGGGSSDAAAFLLWLNSRSGERSLDQESLAELALSLGADVPFFLRGQPAWVTGIGERLEPAPLDLSDQVVLVVCPGVHVNTKWAYGRWDKERAAGLVAPRKGLTPKNSPIMDLCFTKPPMLWNVFEQIVFREFPMLYGVKKQILEHFAEACVMSGSGSSFVAFFRSPADAEDCARAMRDLGYACHGPMFGRPVRLES